MKTRLELGLDHVRLMREKDRLLGLALEAPPWFAAFQESAKHIEEVWKHLDEVIEFNKAAKAVKKEVV